MSEEEFKRFEAVVDFDNTIEYIMDKVDFEDMDFPDFLDLANALHETNVALQKDLDIVTRLYHKEITTSKNMIDGLQQENQELREVIKNIENCYERNKGMSIYNTDWLD